MRKRCHLSPLLFFHFVFLPSMALAQAASTPSAKLQPAGSLGVAVRACERCIRAHEEFLASDALQGRGSGTHDELVAATYVASQLRQYGIEPAGDNGGFIQRLAVRRKDTKAQSQKEESSTWNVIGVLRGRDSSLQRAAILFSAHLD